MNDFEWRHQLRDLRQPHTPRRDLWVHIEPALEALPDRLPIVPHKPTSRVPWWFAVGLAAVTVLAVGLMRHAPMTASPASQLASTPPWKPEDPRLAGAAIELTAAQYELRQAIEQAPDSPALQRLLDRTEQQQSRLRQLTHDAS